eukprot:scaffold248433_cov13-Tisochrysis_lutea.AAC.1
MDGEVGAAGGAGFCGRVNVWRVGRWGSSAIRHAALRGLRAGQLEVRRDSRGEGDSSRAASKAGGLGRAWWVAGMELSLVFVCLGAAVGRGAAALLAAGEVRVGACQ